MDPDPDPQRSMDPDSRIETCADSNVSGPVGSGNLKKVSQEPLIGIFA